MMFAEAGDEPVPASAKFDISARVRFATKDRTG